MEKLSLTGKRVSGAQLTEFLDKKVDLIIVDKIRSKAENLSRIISVSHSRVSRMIKASLAERNYFGLSSVEVIARKWNIPIYHYSEFLNSIQAYKDSEIEHFINASDVKKLKTPFIKVKDRSRWYRPEFVEMKTVPTLDCNSVSSQSPFQSWYNENVPRKEKKAYLHKRTCELCLGSYFDVNLHLASERHVEAANDDTLFAGVDQLINCARSNFSAV